MIPIDFDGSNAMISGPKGSDVQPLMALSIPVPQEGVTLVISRWKFTAEEWDEVLRTKTVWLMTKVREGGGLNPAQIVGTQPFEMKPRPADQSSPI